MVFYTIKLLREFFFLHQNALKLRQLILNIFILFFRPHFYFFKFLFLSPGPWILKQATPRETGNLMSSTLGLDNNRFCLTNKYHQISNIIKYKQTNIINYLKENKTSNKQQTNVQIMITFQTNIIKYLKSLESSNKCYQISNIIRN